MNNSKHNLATALARLQAQVVQLQLANEQLTERAEAIQRSKDAMGHMAQHDFLTGLPNRYLLTERLDSAVALAQRHGSHFAVLFLDLDHFKLVNDSLGHPAGDALLQEVAQRLLGVIRATDTASRHGGDEFVVILSDIADEHTMSDVAAKICAAVARPYALAGGTVHIGVTIGISVFPNDGATPAMLLRNADLAMYHAKDKGRDRYHFYRPDMTARDVERASVAAGQHCLANSPAFLLRGRPRDALSTCAAE